MLSYMIKHPTLANLLMLLALMLGFFTYNNLTRETFPDVNPYTMTITVAYPGASASEIESSICEILEEDTNSLTGLKEKTCTAQDSAATMSLQMRDGENWETFKDDVNTIVDSISGLPADSEDPVLSEAGLTDAVVSIALYGPIPSLQLDDLAEEIKDELMTIAGVAEVDISGFGERQIKIDVDPNQLRALNLSIGNLSSAITNQSLDTPLGSMDAGDRQISMRITDMRRTVEQLENIVVRSSASGSGELLLGDVARIYEDFEDDDTRIIFNGNDAAILAISKNSGDDGVDILHAIEDYVDDKIRQLPAGIGMELTNDNTSIALDRLQLIMENGAFGLLLVFIVVWLFFTWKYSFWVAMGLPVSFFAGFAAMSILGVSLNMISMVALLISLGILMDDAIVISESIAERIHNARATLGHRLTKDEYYAAVTEGVRRVTRGVLSSFATTVMVFSGTLMISGDIGQVLVVLPIVLLIVISVSLIEAFLILPNHLAHASFKDAMTDHFDDRKNFIKQGVEDGFAWLSNKVHTAAKFSVRQPYVVLALTFIAFFSSIGLLAGGAIKFSAFPESEGNTIAAYIHMPSGTTQARTEEVVFDIVDALETVNEEFSANEPESLVQNVTIQFSTNSEAGESGVNVATVNIDVLDVETRNTTLAPFITRWREEVGRVPDAQSILLKVPGFAIAGNAIEYKLSGRDLEELKGASLAMQEAFSHIEGAVNVSDDLNAGRREIQFSLKQGAYALGVTSNSLSSQLRAAYVGQNINEIQQDGREIEVVLGYSNDAKDSLDDLDNLMIFSDNTGEALPIDQVANTSWNQGWSKIIRVNNMRTITLTGDVDSSLGNTNDVLAKFTTDYLPEIQAAYPGVKFLSGGEQASTQESMGSLMFGFLLALFGVYILLSAQFRNYSEPFLVMSVIPLALMGSITGHWIMGVQFSMPSMMGYISLGGIVVNNSILLAEFIRLRINEDGMSLRDAAAQAAKDRFRAIFMTTLTTVAGMTPMLFETSQQAVTLIPLVTSMLFGLMSAGILVLLVVPALYSIMADVKGNPEHLEQDDEDVYSEETA